jgi:aspartyl-tRNA(Asn)/glutamyl-tRNA(Gln) amidotransferase subunit C
MVRDLNSILGHIDSLNELDTSNVEPMAQVSDRYGVDQSKQGSDRFTYASRDDIREGLRKSLPQQVALENAPDSDGTFFEVPKVIER